MIHQPSPAAGRPKSSQDLADQTLAELATSRAGAAAVFHRRGLDFCCGGRVSLSQACERAGLDPAAIAAEVEAAAAGDSEFEPWTNRPLDALIDHILARYHERHRAELPPLIAMARKVESRHGEKASCPRGLALHLEHLSDELEQHMQKEEEVLFPMLRRGRGRLALMPIQVMESEHEDHGKNLARMRELAHGYAPPPEACNTWIALYLGLAELDREVHHHIHLENNVLFPRALNG